MKLPHWRQDTPAEQAVAIIAGIEGWLHNLEEGVSSPERVAEKAKPLLRDLLALTQHNMLPAWPEEACEPEP